MANLGSKENGLFKAAIVSNKLILIQFNVCICSNFTKKRNINSD